MNMSAEQGLHIDRLQRKCDDLAARLARVEALTVCTTGPDGRECADCRILGGHGVSITDVRAALAPVEPDTEGTEHTAENDAPQTYNDLRESLAAYLAKGDPVWPRDFSLTEREAWFVADWLVNPDGPLAPTLARDIPPGVDQ